MRIHRRPARPDRRARAVARRRSVRPHFVAAGCVTLILLALSAMARAEEEPRTLDAVTIEGEVRLPEVLFITSRDVARPLDWLDHYSGPGCADLAKEIDPPFDVTIVPAPAESPDVVPESTDPPRSEPIRSTEEETR